MLNKIFIVDKLKNHFHINSLRPKDNIKKKGESEKKYEIRMLKNLASRYKLKKDYIDKLMTLLYSCKGDKKYLLKRNNIDKTIYKVDSKNNLSITLPEFFKNKQSEKKLKNQRKSSSRNINSFINNLTPQTQFSSSPFSSTLSRNTKKLKENLEEYTDTTKTGLLSDKNSQFYSAENIQNNYSKINLNPNVKEFSINDSVTKLLNNNQNELPLKQEKKLYNRLEKLSNKNEQLLSQTLLPKFKMQKNTKNNMDLLFEITKNHNIKERNQGITINNYIKNIKNNKTDSKYCNKYSNDFELSSIFKRAGKWKKMQKKILGSKRIFKISSKIINKNKKEDLDNKGIESYIYKKNTKVIKMKDETNKLVKTTSDIQNGVQNMLKEIEKHLSINSSKSIKSPYNSFDSSIKISRKKALSKFNREFSNGKI